MTKIFAIGALLAGAGALSAQPVIDGANFGSEYPAAFFGQTVGTQFGDNNDPTRDLANGSEINALFGRVQGNTLYVGIAGNLETNFNKLDLFFDVRSGGQNRLRGDNPNVDFDGLNRMGDDGSGNGLIFDTGFESDYFLTYTNGNDPAEHFLSVAETLTMGGGNGTFVGGGVKSAGAIMGMGINGGNIVVDSDNSNILGVGPFGTPNMSDPTMVFTGIEIAIPLSELGWDGVSPIMVAGFVNGGGHDFLSNQVIGGLDVTTGNLGEPRMVDFNQLVGGQYVMIPIPAPGAATLLAIGGLVAMRRRR